MGNYDDRDRGGRSSGGDLKPLEVHVDGDNVERALRTLKRKMAEEGIFRELKKRRFYEKPSEAKKRKSAEATRRRRKAERKLRTGR
jgi:small subunit ribosomal protein S21